MAAVTTSTPKGKAAATAPPPAASNSASFVSKPARGWLHPDYLFAKDGINYNVRYMGCLEVNTSMVCLHVFICLLFVYRISPSKSRSRALVALVYRTHQKLLNV